jgi:LuxR family maltose regulon positive regulatory protein
MSQSVLATKLYVPPARLKGVRRSRLIDRLNDGLAAGHKLTLVSAPAGFGKTTLISEWIAGSGRAAAWLSLDIGDNDPARFLTYLIAAIQTVAANVGESLLGVLQAPQSPPIESILTTLLNQVSTLSDNFILVLDDYHVIDAKPIENALGFLIEHMPPQIHLVVATREDPQIPLPRIRAQARLTELRAADLRFTLAEAAEFFNQVMGLDLSPEDVAALETRTEGWVAGLQLAALALQGGSFQGQNDTAGFITSFSGSHHFVMDYLVTEVLHQQPDSVQAFLLRTSILDRMCGPLCDAVLRDGSVSGQDVLEYLERTNLFIIPLDNERRWYRYHHLFADLLRQRLQQNAASIGSDENWNVAELHVRASAWFEENDLELEAFQHAVAANDVDRAARLSEGKSIPLHFRGAVMTILDWLSSLPAEELNARPLLWWRYASLQLINGHTTGVEEKLQAAEAAMAAQADRESGMSDEESRNLIGQIATARATLALTRYDTQAMLAQSQRALEYLHPESLFTRSSVYWVIANAHLFMGDRVEARRAFTEAAALGQTSGAAFTSMLAIIGLGNLQEGDNQLHQAAETYRRVLKLAEKQPLQIVNEAQLGLARVLYEWNDLDAAEHHGRQSLLLAQQYDRVIDRYVISEVFLARLKLAREDVDGASAKLTKAHQAVRQNNWVLRAPEVAAAQVLVLLKQGNLKEADQLAHQHDLPMSRARVFLAQGKPSEALTALEPLRLQAEAKGWEDERLKVSVLQAVALHAHDDTDRALQFLSDVLVLAEPGDFMRTFIDEGDPMARLLSIAAAHGMMPDYVGKLLAAFGAKETQQKKDRLAEPPVHPMVEPLSTRELEILLLIAEGLSNQEIGERLFLALSTVKGHNREIFGKLQVQRRTEAVKRARELGLL